MEKVGYPPIPYIDEKCKKKKGTTWWIKKINCKNNTTLVSCVAGGGGGPCNPYSGDTVCANYRPILCVNKVKIPRPAYTPDPCPGCAYSAYPEFY